jgi:hypothetical protein
VIVIGAGIVHAAVLAMRACAAARIEFEGNRYLYVLADPSNRVDGHGRKLAKAVPELASTVATIDGSPALSFAYLRDDLGRITQKTETRDGVSRVFGYQYDPAGRLTEVIEDGDVVGSYAYDGGASATLGFLRTASQ